MHLEEVGVVSRLFYIFLEDEVLDTVVVELDEARVVNVCHVN